MLLIFLQYKNLNEKHRFVVAQRVKMIAYHESYIGFSGETLNTFCRVVRSIFLFFLLNLMFSNVVIPPCISASPSKLPLLCLF